MTDSNDVLPVLSSFLSVLSTFLLAVFTDVHLPIPDLASLVFGFTFMGAGTLVLFWSTSHLGDGIAGAIKPETDTLVTSGPYSYVRHPFYLSLTLTFLGFFVLTRNLIGVLGIAGLFLPSEYYRAKLEEKALSQRFGEEWETYVRDTGFFFPPLSKLIDSV